MKTDEEIIAKAESLGATHTSYGMNWVWVHGFVTNQSAKLFVDWLDENCIENRGVYPPHGTDNTFAVRFR